MVMESKTTSKTSCLKALLLRAWRERWTDLQWGINIKTVLPRGVSGDVYNLADCILQQAVVGAGANQLVLSYLRHSLSAQLVSHAAVLQRLSKYSQMSKVHCVFSLLEFFEGMLPGITVSCGKPEETVLATAVLSVALWLLNILQHCQTNTKIIQKTSELLKILLTDDFYISMMCLARCNDPDLFTEASSKCLELESILGEEDEILPFVRKLSNMDVNILQLPIKSENWPGSLIQCWLQVKLTGNPGTPTSALAQQLRIFKKLKGFSHARLYAELMRGSLMSLYNAKQTSHESQWSAFAFLKVPHILLELAGTSDSASIVSALELMLQHSPLLDAMDANSSCSSFECLLNELSKNKLLSETQVKMFLEKRKTPPSLKIDSVPGNNMSTYWHICAESTLTGILKTLSSDYQKIQDALLKMLHQVLAGNSFELILAVATVQDKLGTLVNRLIKFNECSKSAGESKSQLFDITFVMLVTIVQNYGASAVLDSDGDSLFEQWVKSCMVERNKPKAADQILRLGDPVIIQSLLEQFNSGESEFKPGIKWQELLFNIPGVMHEVLVAWEQGTLVPQDVKRILDAVRGKMCCLPIVAAAWLCAYMRTAPQDTLLKPINMVQQLLNTPGSEEDNFNDRWQLTCEIIRKMQRDVQLPLPQKSGHYLVSRKPATEQLGEAWKLGIVRGWLDHNSARTLHCLLETAGTRWLVSAVIQELVKLRYRDQLQRGIDLALAMFHVDIVGCTRQLLSHVLPQLLYNDIQADGLMEPQLPALAYVTSYCVFTAWDALQSMEDVDTDPPVAKMSRLSDTKEEEAKPLEQLLTALRQLLYMFEGVIQEGSITQQTYFAFYLIKSLVEVKVPTASAVLAAIPSSLISDLLKTMPDLFSYPLLLHIHDVTSTAGRINMAKDLCILRNYYLKNAKDVATR
ncbi:mediator of RNA polymerase II transcription subunit 24 isoform X1 [Diabrotica virgifera virgifera]|uniref:Mediator of RNA polymerase II transcription subunit 24 n=1 Tax=Diabrotica virgifera virgifera TaxID=50390 RepID=A0ABM5L849_DIAVI|nr:mediator of RNA polymerase II transcription subunit 24 isoform X1 [Diabrotica virgifera virgifera]XP_050518617.1 mediator of RNA polymerase II transcription subunit 24 isoform X1 [Diabrotica virgifera virgifera]